MTVELRKVSLAVGGDVTRLRGLSVQARDGSVGTVRDVVDRVAGAYLVIDTGPWTLGKTIKLPAGVVGAVDVEKGCVLVDCTREDIRQAPEFDPDASPDVAAGEALNRQYAGGTRPDLSDVKPATIPPAERDATVVEPSVSGIGRPVDAERPEAAPDRVPTLASGELADTPRPSRVVGAERRGPTDSGQEHGGRRKSRDRTGGAVRQPSSSSATSPAPKTSSVDRRPRGAPSDGMPIARYDSLTAAEVIARLRGLSQRELASVERYEKRRQNRQTVLRRVGSLREDEPWRGYDDATVGEVTAKLSPADADRTRAVRDYERRHRGRKGVMEATRRALTLARS